MVENRNKEVCSIDSRDLSKGSVHTFMNLIPQNFSGSYKIELDSGPKKDWEKNLLRRKTSY